MSEQDLQNNRDRIAGLLQRDLYNEVSHMMFYLRAASEVEGLHREELKEFFLKEAHEEMGHVHEFADMLSYFGVSPLMGQAPFEWKFGHNPHDILKEVIRMEEEVAANYAMRLQQTEAPDNQYMDLRAVHHNYDPWIAATHVFYEDQIKNSQMTAWEVRKWMTKFPIATIIS